MAGLPLDKNPNNESYFHVEELQKPFEINSINGLICKDPFLKAGFLEKFIQTTNLPIIYLDFDLLYSGYIKAGMLNKKENVRMYTPTKDSWKDDFKDVLSNVSKEKSLIVIDSLNGFNNSVDGKDSGRLIDSYIMLLGSIARESESIVLFVSVARYKEEDWILVSTGRRIIESQKISKFLLQKKGSEFIVSFLGEKTNS